LRQGRRGKTFCPFEEFTAISARSCSRPLQRRIVDFSAERSGEKTIVALQEHYGITVSLHAVQNISREAATRAKALNSQVPTQSAPTSKTLIAQLDGSMVPVINFGEVDQTQAAAVSEDRRKKRQTCWKELRLCTVTAQGRDFTRYGVSRGSPFEVGCMMNNTCRHEGMTEQTHIHGVADGATWIAEQFERQFGTRHSFLLDFYHACQYLSAASAKVSQNKEMQTCWYQKQKKALLAGEVKEVLAELEKHIDLSGDQENDSVSICLRYLGKRCEQLDYPSAKAAKLPIGSGEVESGHRHILQQRLKIPGAWWKIETADEMAHLRVLRANDRWNELWQQDAA